MLDNYFPILMFIVVGAAIGVAPMALGGGLSRLLGVHRPDSEKLSPYECGFEAFEDARMKFDVRYYLVAILFILFDLEIAFLFFPVGDRAAGDRPLRLHGDDGVPGDTRGGLHLRVEEGSAGMGVATRPAEQGPRYPGMRPGSGAGADAMAVAVARSLQRRPE